MPYKDNVFRDVYGGQQYVEAHTPSVREPRVAKDVSSGIVDKGISAISNNIRQFGDVLQKRYKDKCDNENQLQLQKESDDFKRGLNERMQLPNGVEGSFYDKDGKPDLRALQSFVDDHLRRARQTNKGYATPWDKQERDDYLAKYAQKTQADAEAALIGSVKQRGLKAFGDSYKLYMAKDDFSSAANAARKAFDNKLLSKDERDLYIIRALKGGARKSARSANGSGARELTDSMILGMREREPEEEEEVEEEVEENAEPEDGERQITLDYDARPSELKWKPRPDTQVAQPVKRAKIELADAENAPDKISVGADDDIIYTTSLYMDNPNDPRVYTAGLSAMNVDEFSQVLSMNAAKAASLDIVPAVNKSGLPDMHIESNEAAPEPMQRFAHSVNTTGGISMSNYKKAAYAVCSGIIASGSYDDLSDKDLKELLHAQIDVEGLGGVLFPDEDFPEMAQTSLTNSIIQNVLDTREDKIKSKVHDVIYGKEGLPGTKAMMKRMDAELAAAYKPSEEIKNLQGVERSMWKSERDKRGAGISGLYNTYKDRFLAESGLDKNEVGGAGEMAVKFKEWFFAEGSVADELRADFVEDAKEYMEYKGIEAAVECRRKGVEDWGAVQMEVEKAVAKAKKDVEEQSVNVWSNWRANKAKEQGERARKYREEAKKHWEMLRGEQAKAKERLAPLKEQAEMEKERTKWEEQRQTAERKKQWQEEVGIAKKKEDKTYRSSVISRMCADVDGSKRPTLTVPYEQYEHICESLGAGDGGIVVTYGGSDVTYDVRAGKVKVPTMNGALFNAVYGKKFQKMSTDQVRQLVNGHKAKIKFQKVL